MVFRQHAQEAFEHSMPVIPADGKRIRLPGWTHYCKVLPKQSDIDQWIQLQPNANIGLCMGEASGIIGFDVDTFEPKILALIKDMLPKTPAGKKGKKEWTWFYKYSSQQSRDIKYKGIEVINILSAGRQTIIPPSIHPETNEPYIWYNDVCVWDVIDELAELPEDLILQFQAAINGLDLPIDASQSSVRAGRNNTLKAFVCALIGKYPLEEIMAKLIMHDKALFGKNNFCSDKSENSGSSNIKKNAFRFVNSIYLSVLDKQELRGEEILIGNDKYSELIDNGFYVKDNKGISTTPLYNELSLYLKEQYHLKVNESVMFIYNDDHYRHIRKNALMNIIENITNSRVKPSHYDQFYKKIIATCYENFDEFQNPDGYLNLKNGILDIKNKTLINHSPEYFFKYILPHEYNPNATYTHWLEFLNYIFDNNQSLIDVCAEIFGYTMYGGDPWLHKAFVCHGEGRNGKSTFLEVLMYLLGQNNFESVSMSNLNKPFSVVRLDGKLANIVEETPTGVIDSENFKNAVGGGYLTAAHKGKPEFQLKCNARLLFACNRLPFFGDATVGSYERLYFIPFNQYIKEKDRVPQYSKRLLKEISGIMNWAIEGLCRVLNRRYLPVVEGSKAVLEEYRRESDNVYNWAESSLIIDQENGQQYYTKSLYQRYYSSVGGERHAVNETTFNRRLSSYIKARCVALKIDDEVFKYRDSKRNGYKYIKIVEDRLFMEDSKNLSST